MKQEVAEEMKYNFASQITIYFFWFCRQNVFHNTFFESIVLDIWNANGLER